MLQLFYLIIKSDYFLYVFLLLLFVSQTQSHNLLLYILLVAQHILYYQRKTISLEFHVIEKRQPLVTSLLALLSLQQKRFQHLSQSLSGLFVKLTRYLTNSNCTLMKNRLPPSRQLQYRLYPHPKLVHLQHHRSHLKRCRGLRVLRLVHIRVKNKGLPVHSIRIVHHYVAQSNYYGSRLAWVHHTEQKISQHNCIRELLKSQVNPLGQKKDNIFQLFPAFLSTYDCLFGGRLGREMNKELQSFREVAQTKQALTFNFFEYQVDIGMGQLIVLPLQGITFPTGKSFGNKFIFIIAICSCPLSIISWHGGVEQLERCLGLWYNGLHALNCAAFEV